MVDLKEELQYYPPINLKALVEDESEIPDNIKNSIALYNKAIESLKMDSEDIAIIELKKAISINPNFYEAMNLLGLCYAYVGEHDKAAEMFNKVISAENNSVRALGYLNKLKKEDSSIGVNKSRKRSRGKASSKESSNANRRQRKTLDKKGLKADIRKYLIGFTAGGLLVLLISLVAFPTSEPPVDIDTMKKQFNEEINLYKSKYNDLKRDYDSLQDELTAANSELEYYTSLVKLYEIESMFSNKKYEEAADMLLLMKTVDFRDPEKEKFNSLYEKIMPVAAESLYVKGKELYNQGKYEEALNNLDKVETYMKDYNKMDAVLYYKGKCYQALNDFAKAKIMYNKLISDYPETNTLVYWAKVRLSEMP